MVCYKATEAVSIEPPTYFKYNTIMQEYRATLAEHQRFDRWNRWTLHAPALAGIKPGQYAALRVATPGSYDSLVPVPVWAAAADTQRGTITILAAQDDPAAAFLARQPAGGTLNLLAPLGRGWQLPPSARTLAIVGTHAHAGALFGLAQHAVARGLAVSLVLGVDDPQAAPPPFLLPADAEYNVAQGTKNKEQGTGKGSKAAKKRNKEQNADLITNAQSAIQHPAAAAALHHLSDDTLRWADVLAVALPLDLLPTVAQRMRNTRLNWTDNMAQALVLPPPVCHVGVCGVCAVPTRQGYQLACVDGPVFDLKKLAR